MRFKFLIKIVGSLILCATLIIVSIKVVPIIERKYVYKIDYKEYVIEYSKKYRLDAFIVFSVIRVESGFDKYARSSAGAMGLMQILPKTADFIAKELNIQEYDLLNPKTNIEFGCYYLDYLYKKFEYTDTVMCAYNAGEGNVIKWLNNSKYSEGGKILKTVPFKETEDYREKIQKTFAKYEKLYGNILDKSKIFE